MRKLATGLALVMLAGCQGSKNPDALSSGGATNATETADNSDQTAQVLKMLKSGDIAVCSQQIVLDSIRQGTIPTFDKARESIPELTQDQYSKAKWTTVKISTISAVSTNQSVSEVKCQANFEMDSNSIVTKIGSYTIRPESGINNFVFSYDSEAQSVIALATLLNAGELYKAFGPKPTPRVTAQPSDVPTEMPMGSAPLPLDPPSPPPNR